VQPDVFEVQVKDGDILLFCSDGVWSVIDDYEFATLASKAASAEQLNQTIIDLAMERGSDDNVSAVTIILHKLVHQQTVHSSKFSKIIKRFTARL
jgi:protein phosphatase